MIRPLAGVLGALCAAALTAFVLANVRLWWEERE